MRAVNTELATKLLLVALPGFYGNVIKGALEKIGFEVDLLNERPSESVSFKASVRLGMGIYDSFTKRYYCNALEKRRNSHYDVVLVLRGEYLAEDSIRAYRDAFPSARFILYMWDSLSNYPFVKKRWGLYDSVYTFDPIDAESSGGEAIFRPLFYGMECTRAANSPNLAKNYDIATIATAHSDRPEIVSQINHQCEKAGGRTYCYWYMPSPALFYYNKLLNPSFKTVRRADIHQSFLSTDEACDIIASSVATIDVEHPKQTGLTMRSIETIGLRAKLITTNKGITDYDFYNPDNILVIDRSNPVLDTDFLMSPYKELPTWIKEKYSVLGWLKEILDLKQWDGTEIDGLM